MKRLPVALRWPALAALAAVAACTTVPAPKPVEAPARAVQFRPVGWDALPGWSADRVDEAWLALEADCRAVLARPRLQPVFIAPCSDTANVARDTASVRAWLERHFSPWAVLDAAGGDTGLVTGYYEPLLNGSRTRNARFSAPVYARPDDMLAVELASVYPELAGQRVRARVEGRRVVPYWSRAEIEAGKAAIEGKAIAWVDDAVDAFFLQVQGSGRIRLDDGSTIRVGYADQNGHPYVAIARVLIERGEMTLESASMQAIRAWTLAHPAQTAALLDENPSYVFFRELDPPRAGSLEAEIDGPPGSLGVPLLRERAVAVDARAIPLGAPLWIATTRPGSGAALERLVFAQDTGGAIRGPLRADYFWGHGAEAAEQAGRMRERGRLWILWPRGFEPQAD